MIQFSSFWSNIRDSARELLITHPGKVNDIFNRLEDDYLNTYEFLTSFLLDPFAFHAANSSPFAWTAQMQKWIRPKNSTNIQDRCRPGRCICSVLTRRYADDWTRPQNIEEGAQYMKMVADQGDLAG